MLVGVLSATTAVAADTVSLAVPENIHILSIDGQEQGSHFFGSRAHLKPLSVGEHVLTVRYAQLFNLSADEHDIVKSAPITLRFMAQAGQHYQLTVNPPKHHDDAVAFAKKPDIQLLNKTTGVYQATTPTLPNNTAIGVAPSSTNNIVLLQEIWQRATPQERQAFAAWLAAQAATQAP